MSLVSYVNILQEYFATRREPLPRYEAFDVGTVHKPSFMCKVFCSPNISAEGVASTKKDAKQRAAEQALQILGISQHIVNAQPIVNAIGPNATDNYIGKLNEFASQHRHLQPVYSDGISLDGKFTTLCKFWNKTTTGYGTTKKVSKQHSAQLMYEQVVGCTDVPIKKVVLNENQNKEVLNAFNRLTITSLKQPGQPNFAQDLLIPELLPFSNNCNKRLSTPELQNILSMKGFKFNITCYQINPYIYKLEGSDGLTLFSSENSREQATNDLLNTALKIINVGYNNNLITF